MTDPRHGAGRRALEVGGRTVLLSNPEKLLFPATGFTKRDLVEYSLGIAAAILPHLAGRPVTLARFPDGVDAPGWYQTNCPAGRPGWLAVAEVRGARGQTLRYCLLDDAAALAWAANAAAIELHPLLATLDAPATARALVLDLDARPPAGLRECARLALRLRERLHADGLASFPKTSGGAGLHLYVPLDGADGFDATKAFVRALARELAREDPGGVTDRLPLAGRAGKVLVDWRQNGGNRSLIAPYSLRAASVPLVATPVRWDEVATAADRGDDGSLRFGPAEVLARLRREGDLLAPALARGGRLPPARR
ncbi:non-homologous end-joining DNA ligase [Anaeromyxobacter sp. Fw109-5]|uniref:non-homologous end-joining DNA ligase n=1 Tax=Anaeromyxobacter sp. (strain Fw109-5) TaxID=404589 RepID=UPI0000ED7DEB|nr:non-homologous end-joining DNA ligase [Anaeromyxobacter sp. Fw109-5]ABS25788.1 DNA polymerase LigD polymerase domain [Anaeromyxobacter sp. Fw109-5]